MTDLEIRKYQTLVRVRDFGATHRDLFPARSVAGKLFATVAAAADALPQHETTELAGRGGQQDGAASKAAARQTLRRHVRAIAQVAAAADVPGLGAKFRASLSCSDERLLSLARSFLKEAKPFVDTFVAHELPSNFLRQLQAAIDALEEAMHERASGRAERVRGRARIEATMEEGLRAVRRLSAIVPIKLTDPGTAALWDLARRIEYGRVRNGDPVTPDGSAPTSSTGQPDANTSAA